MIKRQMYGRAGIALLTKRVLLASWVINLRAQIVIDVEAGADPVAGEARRAVAVSITDDGTREVTYAQPQGEGGLPGRALSAHQHSPCADRTPVLIPEGLVVAGSMTRGDRQGERLVPAAGGCVAADVSGS